MTPEENKLDSALRLAANEPAHRPDFYETLLNSTVFILGQSGGAPNSETTLEAGESVSIQNWTRDDGSFVIPFFSSLAALQLAIDQECEYFTLPARSLFEMTKGAALVLNPRSEHGKEFFPNEIEALLSDGINRIPEQRVIKEATQVLLGQPTSYPTELVESLKVFLAQRANAKAAYLALMHDPSQDEKPHLIIGIAATGDFEKLIRETGAIVGDLSPGGEPLDLVRVVAGDTGLSAYFLREVKPFYERSLGGSVKAFFGVGRA